MIGFASFPRRPVSGPADPPAARFRPRVGPTVVAVLAAFVVGGCGGSAGEDDGAAAEPGEGLRVSAAASMKNAFESRGLGASYSFAGSDALAAQIRQGVRPDVFAAANTSLPDDLFDEGLVEEPVEFATNELVVAVPAEEAKVRGFDDLGDDGVTLAVGADGVPVGSYTKTVLEKLPAARRRAIDDNVRSREPDVSGVVGKLTQGAVDAGLVYASDVRGTDGALRALPIPDDLEPTVAYGAAVVKGTTDPEGAREFVRSLRDGEAQRALRAAGFGPPPS